MASLEELLAEEGFAKIGKSKAETRAPPASRTISMPLYHDRVRNPIFDNVDPRFKKGRTRSDVYSRRSKQASMHKERATDGSSRSSLSRNVGRACELEDFDVQEAKGSEGRFFIDKERVSARRSMSSLSRSTMDVGHGEKVPVADGFRVRGGSIDFQEVEVSKRRIFTEKERVEIGRPMSNLSRYGSTVDGGHGERAQEVEGSNAKYFKEKERLKAGKSRSGLSRNGRNVDDGHGERARQVEGLQVRGSADVQEVEGSNAKFFMEKDQIRARRSSRSMSRNGSTVDDGHVERTRMVEGFEVRDATDVQEIERSIGKSQFQRLESFTKFDEYGDNEVEEESKGSRDIYLYKFQKKDSNKQMYLDDYEKLKRENEKNLQVRPSFSDDHGGRRPNTLKNSDSNLSLDKAAVGAVVSILTRYARRFFRDENFRASIRQGCETCLGIHQADEVSSGALTNLREAIATVERVVQEVPDMIELKKAFLKLSVITGLSSKDLKDGYTSGIPNSHMVTCAHIYLSMIYKLQNKDRASAKHLLQVFSESPHQARTTLLPRLWDHLFLPHLSHLMAWYHKESESIQGGLSKTKKIKLLDEVYNNTLDMGTHQFAVYYKQWLMEDVEAPSLPSINIPSVTYSDNDRDDSLSAGSDGVLSPRAFVSSQQLISKRLYESVFSQSKKMEVGNVIRKGEHSEEELVEDAEEVALFHKWEAYKEDYEQDFPDEDEQATEISSIPQISEVNVLNVGCEDTPLLLSLVASNPHPKEMENEHIMERLALSSFKPQLVDQPDDDDVVKMMHSEDLSTDSSIEINLRNTTRTESKLKKTDFVSTNSHVNLSKLNYSAEPIGNYEDTDKGSIFSKIPKNFMCPLTGNLFKEPVTLETGHTFDRSAIKEWFDKGNKTCPVTGKPLECLSVPITNFILKHIIDDWKSEHFRNLFVFATQISTNIERRDSEYIDEPTLFTMEKLLTGLDKEEQMENVKHLISLGGLDYLMHKLELGDLEEKNRVVSLILFYIKADGSCRNYLAMNISKPCIIELLHSEKVGATTNAVLLLIELICLNRRKAITSFITDMRAKAIMKTTDMLLAYLHNSPPEERVLVAIFLLHWDIMVFRKEAVERIIMSLECCLSDEKFIPNTRKALLMLGGHFSSSGKTLTEIWLLKQAGFYDESGSVSIHYEDEVDEMVLGEEEAKEREEWLKSVAVALLCNEKSSFLEILANCLGSESSELVTACLATLAWLSRALSFLSIAEIRLSEFSALLPRLKDNLVNGRGIENAVLASLSLNNFSKISECRDLLMESSEEISNGLKNLFIPQSSEKR